MNSESVERESIELESGEGLPLRVDRWRDPDAAPHATLIVCHGFKGFKRWGFFPYLSRRLAAAGYDVFTMDFSRNGIGDDPEQFTRLDLFAGNTYSHEVADLQLVRDWALAGDGPATEHWGLLGHSRGAVPVMVEARENPRVEAIVTWSGVGRLLRYGPAELSQFERDGRVVFHNARTGQEMAVDYSFVEDVQAHAERFDLATAAATMRAAHLIVHGSADVSVGPEEAELLRAGREEGCERKLIDGAEHTYGARHPFAGTTPALESAIDSSIAWFDRYLVPGS